MALIKLNNQSLTAVTSAGIPIRSGSVLQVVQGSTQTGTTTTSTPYVSTSLSATITPQSTSSKILCIASGRINNTAAGGTDLTIFRDSTNICPTANERLVNNYFDRNGNNNNQAGFTVLDSPSTTSAVTYEVRIRGQGATATFDQTQIIILMEIAG